jgi:hypothetical protein
MTYLMSKKTNRPHRAFWRFVFSFILVFGLLQGFLLKNDVLATNSYIDNITFTKDLNGEAILTFHVLTSFNIIFGARSTSTYRYVCDIGNYFFGMNQNDNYFGIVPVSIVGNHYVPLASCGTTFTYVAGNTYSNIMVNGYNQSYDKTDGYICSHFLTNCGGVGQWNGVYTYVASIDDILTSTDYVDTFGKSVYAPNQWPMTDTQKYYFTEYPTLTITWPANNSELTANFYVAGTFTLPASSTYQYLTLFSGQAGGSSYDNVFNQNINFATSGNMSIWISGLSAGYYDFDIFFRDTAGNFWASQTGGYPITNIHIVNDLPYTLPPFNNQPPIYAPPVYEPLIPSTFYLANSSYSTSTAFYNTLTKTFAPVLLTIGENLTNFSQNFTASNASSTGHQLGNSILLVRSYITNINSFFANFPVGQFLLLYLIALVVVIVLRLVKGLISLFKL